MSDTQPVPVPITVIEENAAARAALERLAAQVPALDGLIKFCGADGMEEDRGENPGESSGPGNLILLSGPQTPENLLRRAGPEAVLPKPQRPGAILDRALAMLARQRQRAQARRIRIGPYTLDPVLNTLERPEAAGQAPVRLTEKEREILEILHEQGGTPIPREELLARAWGYGRDIETHTLETHIYRLRQKIEADPANPALLLTDENGYFLRGE